MSLWCRITIPHGGSDLKKSDIPSLKKLVKDHLDQYTSISWGQDEGDIRCSVTDVPYEVLQNDIAYEYAPESICLVRGKMWISWSLDD